MTERRLTRQRYEPPRTGHEWATTPQCPKWATNEPRLGADIPDSTTNHPERATREPRLTSAPSEPRVSHDWAPTYPTALRTTPNEPRFLSTLPRRSHESCQMSLIRGYELPISQESPRIIPTHHELATVHPEPPRFCPIRECVTGALLAQLWFNTKGSHFIFV